MAAVFTVVKRRFEPPPPLKQAGHITFYGMVGVLFWRIPRNLTADFRVVYTYFSRRKYSAAFRMVYANMKTHVFHRNSVIFRQSPPKITIGFAFWGLEHRCFEQGKKAMRNCDELFLKPWLSVPTSYHPGLLFSKGCRHEAIFFLIPIHSCCFLFCLGRGADGAFLLRPASCGIRHRANRGAVLANHDPPFFKRG